MAYIEREAAIEVIMSEPPDAHYPQWYADKIKAISADDVAQVRHGRWIDRIDNDTPMHECSVCGARAVKGLYEYENPNRYCYHCGARMDLEV